MKFLCSTILSLFFIVLTSYGNVSESDSIYIKEIRILGLSRTRADVALRELPRPIPGYLTMTQLEHFKHRLTNQLLYKNINFDVQDDILTIKMEEIFPIYIAPIFFLVDRSWDKLNYGLEFTHFNLRGDKIYLSMSGWAGYDPGFKFTILDDWVGNRKLIAGFSISSQTSSHKIYGFDEKHSIASITGGKRITPDISILFTTGVHFFYPPEAERSYFKLNKSRYVFYQKCVFLNADTRDYKLFALKGYYVNMGFSSESPSFSSVKYRHGIGDFRFYLNYKATSLAVRSYMHIANQELPAYDAVYFGFSERIRGSFNLIHAGRFLALHQMEYRFPLMGKKQFSLFPGKSFPYNYLNNVSLAFYAGIFAESAVITERFSQSGIKNSISGYGISFYTLLPYHNLLRFDFAFDDHGKKEFILEMRASF